MSKVWICHYLVSTFITHPSKIVDFVSFDPAGIPIGVFSPGIYFVRICDGSQGLPILIIVTSLIFICNSSSWIYGFGLCAMRSINLSNSMMAHFVNIGPLISRVPLDVGVHVGVHHHHHDDDVEGVEQPHVDHLDVRGFRNHFIYRGLNCCDNHHCCDCNHYPILK